MKGWQTTVNNKTLGVLRIFLGIMFMMTGAMKIWMPTLREAFSGQLIQANLPLHDFNMWFVPLVEILIGILLLVGWHSRVASAIVIGIMIVATYTHLVVSDPSLFPLQPHLPIGPIMFLLISAYILWKGGGSWSWDLNTTSDA